MTSTWSCLKRFSRSYFSPSRRTICVCNSRAFSASCDESMLSISRGFILCFKIALFSASSCSLDFFAWPSPYKHALYNQATNAGRCSTCRVAYKYNVNLVLIVISLNQCTISMIFLAHVFVLCRPTFCNRAK